MMIALYVNQTTNDGDSVFCFVNRYGKKVQLAMNVLGLNDFSTMK